MFEVERYGEVEALHQGRSLPLLGPLLTVRCYVVDGLMVDTGLYAHGRAVAAFARDRGVRQVAVTHHHEDHSNNAAALQARGLPVAASEHTRAILARGFSTRAYQRLAWGRARAAEVDALPEVIETERHRFEVIPAPGHCEDQVVLYERARGWLFSGDAFLAPRVRLFRADEDFAATVASLERLTRLEVSALFCAHRPVPVGGGEALRAKLDHLRGLEQAVRERHARGVPEAQIARELLGVKRGWAWLTLGDASTENLVRAILHGPRPRPDTARTG